MDRDEFVSRVSACRPALLRAAKSMLSRSDCEDAVQSAILTAWEKLPQLRDEASFDAWLRRILVNICRETLRKRKQAAEAVQTLAAQSAEMPQEDGALGEAMGSMRPEEQELLLLHHEQGYSLREIASMMEESEDIVKMRLYRARKRLRLILVSLLLLLLLAATAIGTGKLDVHWFLKNRRADPMEIVDADQWSVREISYDGLYLEAEITDSVWDKQLLCLYLTYSLGGTSEDALTVYTLNVGADGERFDYVWWKGEILPVEEWAGGKDVYLYDFESWHTGKRYFLGSHDSTTDGKGESSFDEIDLSALTPDEYASLLGPDGTLELACDVFVRSYATGELLEQGTLSVRVSAPSVAEWRNAYDQVYSR